MDGGCTLERVVLGTRARERKRETENECAPKEYKHLYSIYCVRLSREMGDKRKKRRFFFLVVVAIVIV